MERNGGSAGLNRRVFLRNSAGVAGGVAVTVTPAAALALAAAPAGASEQPAEVVSHPIDDVQGEPVTAYVHNAERNEVTVMAGTREVTYRDPVLTRRLLDAATRQSG